MKKFLVILMLFVSVFGITCTSKVNAGGQWTKEEVDILTYYHGLGCKNYVTMLQDIHKLPSGRDRTIDEVQSMYRSLFLCSKKKRFTPDEDNIIKMYVSQYGGIKNALPYLKTKLNDHTDKSIRERYKNYIAPFHRQVWSATEDQLLFQKQNELGNKWAKIALFLPGKTSIDIKNRWYGHFKGKPDRAFCAPYYVLPNIASVHNSDTNQSKDDIDDSIPNEFFDPDLVDDQFNFSIYDTFFGN